MKILLDCDPGHDDAIALLLALASPEVDLVGVTTVHGNQTLEKTTVNALKLLEFTGRTDVPVAAGAARPFRREPFVAEYVHGESGMDGPSLRAPTTEPDPRHAVDFIADTIRASDEPITLVPTGPLTNIGLFLALHPDAAEKVDRIVLMGGAYGEGNVTPAAEFNIWVDPEAAERVFQSGLDVTMIGLDVTHQAIFGPEPTAQLKAAGRVGAMVAELLEFYGRFHKQSYGWDGSPIHDAVAMTHAFKPGIVETRHVGVKVDCGEELGRGRTNCDLRGRVAWEPNAHVAVGIDAEAFIDLLVERISSLGVKLGAITLQWSPWAELTERWRYLDELGVETIWVADHLGSERLPPGAPWFEAWSCLTALAYETKRARIGPLVSPMTYRNPGVLARQALTVAEISGGRLELGIGSGASAYDHEATQVPEWTPKERAAAFVTWTERLVEMLAFERYDPKHDIRLTIAGRGPTILGLAARYAYRWNTFGGFGVSIEEALESAKRDNARLDELCAETGRTVVRSILLGYHGFIPETPWRSDEAFAQVIGRWSEAGFDEAVFYYPPDTNMPEGSVTPGVFERAFTAP